MSAENVPAEQSPVPRVRSGEPLVFQNVGALAGICTSPAKAGEEAQICVRLGIASDAPEFHKYAQGLADVVSHMAGQAGTAANIARSDLMLLVLHEDRSARLWLDNVAVVHECTLKRSVEAGDLIFESDIADVTSMRFPEVVFAKADKVICIFREGWRFALAFDFNPDGDLDVRRFEVTLGTLARRLRYRHLYDALENTVIFSRILTAGWFPFVEIISTEFRDLLSHCESGFDLVEIEQSIVQKFDADRMGHLLDRWKAKPHFASKIQLLEAAIAAFNAGQPIFVLKVILTEIEGVLNEAYKAAHAGQGAKTKALLNFAIESARSKTGSEDSLMLPSAFGEYLRNHTFADFDPREETGTAGSRHAVGHGAAPQDSYTMTRALQAILTLDQLAFFT